MKQLVIAWLALLALAFVLAGSCAIDHRSGAFECTKTADCDPPRTCSDGLCVLPGGAIDAPAGDAKRDGPLPPDAFLCPSQCTSCNPARMECIIDCAAGANCNNQVVCPEGWNCNIKCNTTDSCRGGINCLASDSCTIACTGTRSCRNTFCGPGPCNVTCAASQACQTTNCDPSCACDVKCTNGAACTATTCSLFQCSTDFGRGCSSTQSASCDTCP
jgi:hypothetical protein